MTYYIHIHTDSNRNYLHVGMTDNLQRATGTYSKLGQIFSGEWSTGTPRLVYYEAYASSEEAVHRFNEVSRYTRMQKERLIRRRNPNWLDLAIRALPLGLIGTDHNAKRRFA